LRQSSDGYVSYGTTYNLKSSSQKKIKKKVENSKPIRVAEEPVYVLAEPYLV